MKSIFNDSFHTYRYCHNKYYEFNNDDCQEFHTFRSVENGKIVVECLGKTVTANKGDLLYLPAERHAEFKAFAEPNCLGKVMRLIFLPEVDLLGYPPQAIKLSGDLKQHFEEIPIINPFVDKVTNEVVWKTYRFLTTFQKEVTKYTDRHSLKIQAALGFMKENDIYTINELAEYCGMSERRFDAAFKKILGTSPVQIKQRIQAVKADTLLKTTEFSVEEIAKMVGFSPNQLRNVMKKRYSALPKDIRKKE